MKLLPAHEFLIAVLKGEYNEKLSELIGSFEQGMPPTLAAFFLGWIFIPEEERDKVIKALITAAKENDDVNLTGAIAKTLLNLDAAKAVESALQEELGADEQRRLQTLQREMAGFTEQTEKKEA